MGAPRGAAGGSGDARAPATEYATVGELLASAAERLSESGSETPRLDAELILGHVLHVDRASLLAHPEAQVGPGQRQEFEAGIARRAEGEPVAYIRGTKEFYGLALIVDRRALIPRPETELLVDLALARVREALTAAPRPEGRPLHVWDVGTGSGAVVVALAVECRRRGYGLDVRFLATDDSLDALALATENAVAHGVADVVEFAAADVLDLPGAHDLDLVVANLPYIPSGVVPQLPRAASYEPREALDGGEDGLAVIRQMLRRLPSVLAASGTALVEIGADQASRVTELAAESMPGRAVRVHADLAGLPRVAEVGPLADRAGDG